METLKTRVNILGYHPGVSYSMTGLHSAYVAAMQPEGAAAESEDLKIRFCEEPVAGGLFRCHAELEAKRDVFVTNLSCLFLRGIFAGKDFARNDSLFVYLCRQTWEGEGQWKKVPLREFGFFPKSTHQSTDSFHIVNTGSYTTANIYPVLFLSDEEAKEVWAFQFEPVGSYHIELGYDRSEQSVFVNFECVSDKYLQSGVQMRAGQTLQSEFVTYGKVKGDLNDALRSLTLFRREIFPKRDYPIVYNDYMNALWGNPSGEALLPLIDAAADAGAEAFCIDAGWFMPQAKNWAQSLGDWEPSADRFGELGFRGIIGYIRQKGMLPGCWMEMECVSPGTEPFGKEESWFLCKYGKRIGGGTRYFLNYENPAVCAYMAEKVRKLYGIGIRYIKNDYNDCMGSGADFGDGSGLGYGVGRAVRAFLKFIDALKSEFPDLYIENCGSGAMRSDYAVLKHFSVQSVTDQEDYILNHSITAGTLLNILPEHMGVWAYPLPLPFDEMRNVLFLDSPDYRKRQKNGEETIFNLCNGMLGRLYLSGHIDRADENNFRLISEGIRYYGENREQMLSCIPQFLTPLPALEGDNEFSAILFRAQEGKSFLFLFRLGKKKEIRLDLGRWFQSVGASIAYGKTKGKTVRTAGSMLTAAMPVQYSAMIVEIQDN